MWECLSLAKSWWFTSELGSTGTKVLICFQVTPEPVCDIEWYMCWRSNDLVPMSWSRLRLDSLSVSCVVLQQSICFNTNALMGARNNDTLGFAEMKPLKGGQSSYTTTCLNISEQFMVLSQVLMKAFQSAQLMKSLAMPWSAPMATAYCGSVPSKSWPRWTREGWNQRFWPNLSVQRWWWWWWWWWWCDPIV